MAATKSRLGRGLGSLIAGGITTPEKAQGKPKSNSAQSKPAKPAKSVSKKKKSQKVTIPENKTKPVIKKGKSRDGLPHLDSFADVPIDKIDPNPYQPRREMAPERINELADSIRSEGLLQPVVVRRSGDRFQIVAGERRWRACQLLQLKSIPVRIVQASDASSAVMSLIENLQRENLNPVEEALGYASLMHDFDLTQEGVAERLGKARASIANTLRLLGLDREIQGFIAKGLISVGHAKVLLGLDDDQKRAFVARKIIENGMSVRDAEKLVQAIKAGKKPGSRRALSEVEETAIKDLEHRLAVFVNTKVQIKHTQKKGKILIDYFGNDDLQRILEKIGMY